MILSAVIELLTGAGGRTGILFENQTINIASIALLTNKRGRCFPLNRSFININSDSTSRLL